MAIFEFTAIPGDVLSANPLAVGSAFTMPLAAPVTISISDGDAFLGGDLFLNEIGDDADQVLLGAGAGGNDLRIYGERRIVVQDAAGQEFILIELEVEGGADDQAARLYVFVGASPAQNAVLSVTEITNSFGDVAPLAELTGGLSFQPNEAGEIVLEAEDLSLAGYAAVADNAASGGEVISLVDNEGTASVLFGGEALNYNILVDLVDVNGGSGEVALLVEGEVVTTVVLDFANQESGTQRLTIAAPDIFLNVGDVIEVRGTGDGQDLASVDRIVLVSNNAPVAVADTLTVTEDDDNVNINLLNNDFDPDGDDLALVSVDGIPPETFGFVTSEGGRTGDLVFSDNGAVSFTAAEFFDDLGEGEIDTVTVGYTIVDDSGGVATSTLTIEIIGVNDAPVVDDFVGEGQEDQAFNGQVVAIDIDSEQLTFTLETGPERESFFQFDADGSFSYEPEDDFNGEDTFEFSVTDGIETVFGTATITVIAVNDAPVIDAQNSDTAFSFTENELEEGPPNVGTANAPGNAFSGGFGTAPYMDSLRANADWLTANGLTGPSAARAQEDFAVSGIIRFADVDIGDTHLVEVVNVATVGGNDPFAGIDLASLFIIDSVDSATGIVNYTLNVDIATIDAANVLADGEVAEIQYTIRVTDDGDPTLFDETVVTATITGSNDAPVAIQGAFDAVEDTVFNGQLEASDVDGDELTFALAGDPVFGDVVVNADGSFVYTPAPEFDGGDTFTFTVSDGIETVTQSATVTVAPVNDAPTAIDIPGLFDTTENQGFTLELLSGAFASFEDADGDALTIVEVNGAEANVGLAVTLATGGLITATAGGTFTFDPNGAYDFLGNGDFEDDVFSITVSDGTLTTTAGFAISIGGINDAPIVTDDAFTVVEGELFADNLLANDIDLEGEELSIVDGGGDVQLSTSVFVQSAGGRDAEISVAADGAVSFDAVAFENLREGETDTVTFNYIVADESGAETPGQAIFTVNGENDAPEIDPASVNLSATLQEDDSVGGADPDGFVRVTASIDFFDVDAGDSHTLVVTNAVDQSGGAPIAGFDFANAISIDSIVEGVATFTFAIDDALLQTLGAADINSFQYDLTLSDDASTPGTDTASFIIDITGVNDAPIGDDLAVSGAEDTDISGTLTAIDIEGDALTFSVGTGPANGTVVVNVDGSFTYTPNADFNGVDIFDFSVTDGLDNGFGVVTVTVDPVNDPAQAIAPDVIAASTVITSGTTAGFIDNTNDGSQHAIGALNGGGFVTVDRQNSGEATGITVFDATGTSTFAANASEVADSVNDPGQDVAVLNNGDFAAIWVESRDTLLVRVFNPDGSAQTAEIVVDDNASSFIDSTPSVAAMADGGFVVAWRGFVNDPQAGAVGQVFARRFDANGNEVQGTTRVDNLLGENANSLNVVGLDNGGFAVAYFVDDFGGGRSLRLSAFDATGFAVARDVIVDDPVELGNGARPSTDQLTNGNIVVAYEALSPDNSVTSFVALFSPTGISLGSPIQVVDFTGNLTDGQRDPSVVALPNGGFVVAFSNDRFQQTNNDTGEVFDAGVVIQQFNADGVAVGEPEFIRGGSKPQAVLTEDGTVAVAVLDGSAGFTVQIVEIELANNPFIVEEDGVFEFDGLSVADVDGDAVTASLQSDNATFFFDNAGTAVITGANTNLVTISGTVAEVNAALAELFYLPDTNFSGDDDVTFSVTDNDAGGAVVDTQVLPFIVTAVNDAPTANDVTVAGDEDNDITGTVVANDPDGDALTFTVLFEGDFLTTVIDPVTGAFTITPDANFNGTDTANILIDDGNGGTVQANINVTINPVNDAPQAVDDTFATDQNTPGGPNLISGGPGADFDPDFNGLTVTEINGVAITDGETITLPSGALFTINTNGAIIYDPNSAFDGLGGGATPETATDIITYTVSDGALTDEGQLTVTISGLNDVPVAIDDSFSVNEDVDTTLNVISNSSFDDFDADGDTLLLVDGVGDVNLSSTVSITTTGGRIATFDVTANGDVTINAAGNFDDLASGETDVAVFTYAVQDSNGGQSGNAFASFLIVGENDAPVAADDAISTDEDTAASGSLFGDNGNGNDIDVDGALNIGAVNGVAANVGQTVTLASGALLLVNADGTFDYDPNGAFEALDGGQTDTDTFTYTLNDGIATDTATVTLTIDGVNDAPVAVNDAFTISETLAGGGTSENVLTNDVDPESQTLELVDGGGDVSLSESFFATSSGGRTVDFVANANGLVSLNTTVFEDLGAGETDTVSFTYQAQDTGFETSNLATATFTITGENDAVVSDGDVSDFIDEDLTTAAASVTFTEIDVNDTVTLALISSASAGDETAAFAAFDFDAALTINEGQGAFDLLAEFDPLLFDALGAGEFASIVYTLELSDGTATEAVTFTVDVQGLNDVPVADDQAITTDEDTPVSGTVTATDVDQTDAVTFTVVNPGSDGLVVINSDGTFTYTPDENFAGTDTFTFEADDGQGGLDTGTVTVTVNPINDAPTASGALTVALFDTTNSLQNTTTGGVGLNTAFTVEMWITANDVGTLSALYSEDQLGVDTTGAIGINLLADGAIQFEVNNLGSFQTAPDTIVNGVPTHVAVTHDSTIAGGSTNTTIFINGIAVVASEFPSPTASTNVLVGRRGIGDNFNGEIGELRLFDVALSNGDVQDGFDNQALVGDAGLVHYFAFNELDGDAFDLTGNGLTLTAVGDGVGRGRSDAPISVNRLAVQEDSGPAGFSILVDDVDANGSDVDVILTSSDGVLSVNNLTTTVIDTGNGTSQVLLTGDVTDINSILTLLEFTPDANFNGSATIQIDILDQGNSGAGGQLTATDTILVEVLPVNDAPVADNQALTTDEDVVLTGTLTAVDLDGDALTFALTTEGANGTTVINSDGTFTYTPDADFNGTDQVFFTVDDGNGGTDLGFFTVTVNSVNDAPVASQNSAGFFSGATTDFVSIDNFAALPTDTFTMSTFIRIETDNALEHIFSYATASNFNEFLVRIEANGEIQVSTDEIQAGGTFTNIEDGAFHHVAVTYDGPAGVIQIFLDGALIATGNGTPGSSIESGGTLVLGHDQDNLGGGFNAAQSVIGDFSDVVIRSDVADAVTIADLAAGIVDLNDPNLVLSGQFDASAGAFVDVSGNGNDLLVSGTITQAPGPDGLQLEVFEDSGILIPLSLDDVDIDFASAGGAPIEVTLTVTDGVLSIADINLATVTAGADGTATVTFEVAPDQVETVLSIVLFTPDPDFTGASSLTFTVSDLGASGAGGALTDTLVVPIDVANVNDAPTANDATVSGDEDTVITGTIVANDIDPGDTLTFSVSFEGDFLTTVIDPATGDFTITPDADFFGTDTANILITDSAGATTTASIFVTVDPVNDAPLSANDLETTDEDTLVSGDVLANDVDIDSAVLSVTAVNGVAGDVANQITLASGALLTLQFDGTFDYDPNGAFENLGSGDSDVDTFTYTMSDGFLSDTSNVTIVIDGVNDAPTAVADAFTVNEDAAGTSDDVLANDLDPENDPLFVTDGGDVTISDSLFVFSSGGREALIDLADDGLASFDGQGNFEDLGDGETDTVSFTYQIIDDFGELSANTATVTYTITGENDEVTLDSSASVIFTSDEDDLEDTQTALFTEIDVNDTVTLTVTDALVTGTQTAAFAGFDLASMILITDEGGSFEFGFSGDPALFDGLGDGENVIIDYQLTLSDGLSSEIIDYGVEIFGVNDAPVADDATATTDEDTAVTGFVIASDADENDTLDFDVALNGANGTATIDSLTGEFTYTPNADFAGTDTFTVDINDTAGGFVEATVTVTVNPIQDAPEASTANALRFDGTDTQRVDVAHNALLSPATDFTVEAVFTTSDASAGVHRIVRKGVGGDQTYALSIEGGNIVLRGPTVAILDGGFVADGLVHTVSAVIDSGTGLAHIYVDGVETNTGALRGTIPQGTEALEIGNTSLDPFQDFDGDVHEIRFFNEVRDAATIAANDEAVLDPEAEDALQLYLTFEGNVLDSSGNDFNGTIVGTPEFVEGAAPQDGTIVGFEDTTILVQSLRADDVDIDFGSELENPIEIRLSAANGVVNVGNLVGTTIVAGANGSAFIEFEVNPLDLQGVLDTVSFTPDADFTGLGSITMVVNDLGNTGGGAAALADTVVVPIEVTNENDAPILDPLAVSGDEDTAISGTVLGNDVDGDVITFSLQSDGLNGTAVVNSDGSFTYTPNADFNGTDTFIVEGDDGNGGDDAEIVTVTVNAVNDAPSAATASALRFDGTDTQRLEVAHNALLSPATDFTVEAVITTSDTTAGVHRILRKAVAGQQTYAISVEDGDVVFRTNNGTGSVTVNGGFVADGLTHTLSVTVESPTNTIKIYVDGVETASQVAGGTLQQSTDPIEIGGTGGAANQDFEGDIHEIRFFNEVRDAATIAANDDQVLDPANEDALQLYLTFEGNLTDSSGNGFDATLASGSLPDAVEGAAPQDGTIVGFEDTGIPVDNILLDDVDIDFNAGGGADVRVTLSVNSGLLNVGALELATITGGVNNNDFIEFEVDPPTLETVLNSITFNPDPDFNGTVLLTVDFSDLGATGAGGVLTDTVVIPIEVTSVNDAPIVDDLAVSGDEDTAISGTVTGLDVDGDTITFILDGDGLNGTTIVNSDGTFTYTPNADFNGTDTFVVFAEDGNGGDDTALVTVTVNAINDAPVVTHSSAGFFDGAVANFGSLASFNDIPTSAITVSAFVRFDTLNNFNSIFSYAVAGSTNEFILGATSAGELRIVSGTRGTFTTGVTTVGDGSFHHVVGVFDSVTGDVELFLDGVSVGSSAGAFTQTPLLTGGTVIIGHEQDAVGGGFDVNEAVIGDIGDIVVIDGVADAATIADLGNGIVDLTDPNTVLVGQYSEPDGAFVDATGNGNDIATNGSLPRVAGPDGITITLIEDDTVNVSVGVIDVDVADGTDELEVTVSVTEGIFDFGGLGSVTVTAGADGSKDVTFNGATTDVLALLDSFQYIPASDFNGSDTIEITVSDLGNTGAGGALVTALNIPVIVAPQNDSPLADDLAVAGDEDTDITGTVIANDVDGDALTFSLDSDGLNGTAVVNSDGSFTYTPNADFNGIDTFTYFVEDGNGGDDIGLVTVTVDPVNDAPVAQDDDVATDEDTILSGDVFADNGNGADEDVDGDNFTVSLVDGSGGVGAEITLPSGALLTLNSNGTFDYNPNGQFETLAIGDTATDTFTYTISDGTLTSQATATITIDGANDTPDAVDDAFAINEDDGPQTDNVLANDSDIDAGDTFQVREGGGTVDLTNTFTVTSAGGRNADFDIDAAGDITINLNGNFEDLAAAETDTITLTYEIEDSNFDTDLATIVYTVTGENDAPTATAIDAGTFTEDDNPAPIELLAVVEDVDGDGLSLDTALDVRNLAGEELTFSLVGTTVTVDSGQFENLAVGETDTVTITYDVTDGGIVSDNASGAITVPNAGFFFIFDFATGTASSVARGGGIDVPADLGVVDGVVITLNPNNDEWAAEAVVFNGGVETILSPEGFVLSNYGGVQEVIGDTFFVRDVVSNGQLDFRAENVPTLNGQQLISVSVPGIDFTDGAPGELDINGVDFTVESTVTNTATFAVTGVNDAVTANDDTFTTDEDVAIIIDPLANDFDPDVNDVLIFDDLPTAANGTVVINAGETLTYTPNADFFGVDTFTYTVSDQNGGLDTATVTITVNNVVDPVNAVAMSAVQGGGNNTGFVINGIVTGDQSGVSVSDAGDVNGDGFDDIVVGAYGADGFKGQSYVVFGKTDGSVINLSDIDQASGVGGFAIDGGGTNPRSGFSVDGAADINGDGLDDLIISSYQEGPNGLASGQAFVIFGKSGDTDRVDLGALGVGEGFAINGVAADEFAGFSVSTISDVNGDGLDDLIVSSAFADIGGAADAGKVHVVFGKADDADLELSAVIPTAGLGFEIIGEFTNEQLGNKVSNAGDFNNDGIEDLIISAPNFDGGGGVEGRAFVVFGKADDAQVDVGDVAAGLGGGIAFDAAAVGDNLGVSVSDAGDFNGDGIDDIIVGASGVDTNGANAGAAYIIFGRVGGVLTSIDLGALSATDGIVINGADAGDSIGKSVSSAGDVNGDGFEDVIIGGNGIDTAGGNTGGAFVVFGTSSTATIELSGIEGGGAGGFLIEGVDDGDFTGGSDVSGGGDINGDGFDDLIVTAKNAAPGGNTVAGETTVIFGGELIGASEANIVGDVAANTLTGSDDFDDRIIGGDGDDTIDGGGGNDYLSGGAGSDVFIFNNGDGDNVIRGFGDISDPGEDVVDVSAFGFVDFASIEAALTTVGLNTLLALDADDSILFLDRDIDSFISAEFDIGSA